MFSTHTYPPPIVVVDPHKLLEDQEKVVQRLTEAGYVVVFGTSNAVHLVEDADEPS